MGRFYIYRDVDLMFKNKTKISFVIKAVVIILIGVLVSTFMGPFGGSQDNDSAPVTLINDTSDNPADKYESGLNTEGSSYLLSDYSVDTSIIDNFISILIDNHLTTHLSISFLKIYSC
jgi:hypothetical protein